MKGCTRVAILLALILSLPAWADIITDGNATPSFTNGTFHVSATTPSSTAPFGGNHPCGADSLSVTNSNCNATWTFGFSTFTTVTSATLTLGLSGLDSSQPGVQEAAYTINGFSLLSDLTSLAEPVVDGGTGANVSGRASCTSNGVLVANCPEYNIYTITITDAGALASLEGGSATVNLQLQGFGWILLGGGTLHESTWNGATLDFSTLDVEGTQGTTNPVPEPSTTVLLLTGVAGFAGRLRRTLRNRHS